MGANASSLTETAPTTTDEKVTEVMKFENISDADEKLKAKQRGIIKTLGIMRESANSKSPIYQKLKKKKLPFNVSPGYRLSPFVFSPIILDSKERMRINLSRTNEIFLIPLMPTDGEEHQVMFGDDVACQYCKSVCDVNYLKCKVCSAVAHVDCLYNRGHLSKKMFAVDGEWSCAECSDLTKLLADDEMLALIDLFDELDSNKNCIIRCEQYIKSKKRICDEFNVPMTPEDEHLERKNFRLMDTDNNGSITWNEFIGYETLSLLSKKNKVELANCLTLKELVLIKQLFRKYDRYNHSVIKPEEAKAVYTEYYFKLKTKLGRSFQEHIRNCENLLGLHETTIPSSKGGINYNVTWDEFVRKITIFIIFDRINSLTYAPASYKPDGSSLNWFTKDRKSLTRELTLLHSHRAQSKFFSTNPTVQPIIKTSRFVTRHSSIRMAANVNDGVNDLLNTITNNQKFKLNGSTVIDTEYLMKNDIKLDNYMLYDYNDFGSSLYVIDDPGQKSSRKLTMMMQSLDDIPSQNNNTSLVLPARRASMKQTGATQHVQFNSNNSKTQKNKAAITQPTKISTKRFENSSFNNLETVGTDEASGAYYGKTRNLYM